MQTQFRRALFPVVMFAALGLGLVATSGQGLESIANWRIKNVGPLPVVRCPDLPLAFTRQFHPFDGDADKLSGSDLGVQLTNVLHQLNDALAPIQSSVDSSVRLNFCLRRDQDRVVVQALLQRHAPGCRASLTFVSGDLTHPGQMLSLDAVVISYADMSRNAHIGTVRRYLQGYRADDLKALKSGRRVFVSGQAVRDDTTVAAADKTMEQLGKTLKHLGLSWTNVVQVKSFLRPMDSTEKVSEVVRSFFPTNEAPPQVFVEWTMTSPIEIELVVNGGPDDGKGPAVEYLTPPGMKASPVFTRVVRVNRGSLVFTSSLYGPTDRGVENEIREIFRELDESMNEMGSNMLHLAKATYYVTTPDSSRFLGQIRPEVYDPKRPPAASKASVRGTGLPGHRINMDLIGVAR